MSILKFILNFYVKLTSSNHAQANTNLPQEAVSTATVAAAAFGFLRWKAALP